MTSCMQCGMQFEYDEDDAFLTCDDCGDEVCVDCVVDGLCEECLALRDENNEGDA